MKRLSGTGVLLVSFFLMTVRSPAEERTFTDWNAACAPDSVCVVYSQALSDKEGRLQIDRSDDGGEAWSIGFVLPAPYPDQSRPIQVAVDSAAPIVFQPTSGYALYGDGGALYLKPGHAGNILFDALRKGGRARLSYLDVTGAPHDRDFSLNGLSAGLLFVAEQQGYDSIGREIAAPGHLIEQTDQDEAKLIADQGIPDGLYDRHMNGSDCEDPYSTRLSSIGATIAPLSPVTTLYAIPCTAHAYNITYRLYTIDRGEIGGIATLYFATFSDTFGWSGTDLLFNISYDAKTATLSAVYKGRGLADCGHAGQWRWGEYAFRMMSFRSREKCDGTTTPDTWETVFP